MLPNDLKPVADLFDELFNMEGRDRQARGVRELGLRMRPKVRLAPAQATHFTTVLAFHAIERNPTPPERWNLLSRRPAGDTAELQLKRVGYEPDLDEFMQIVREMPEFQALADDGRLQLSAQHFEYDLKDILYAFICQWPVSNQK